MPRTAPAKVSISPKAVNTEASITPNGGTKKAVRISTAPNEAILIARTNCVCFLITSDKFWRR